MASCTGPEADSAPPTIPPRTNPLGVGDVPPRPIAMIFPELDDFTTTRTIDSARSYANLSFAPSSSVAGEWTTGVISGSGDQ